MTGRPQLRWNTGSAVVRVTASGFPDASNTGVPPGTTLTPLSGNQTLSTPGTVLEDKDISGSVNVTASGCVVRRCRIVSNDSYVIGCFNTLGTPLLVEDCEIDGTGTVKNTCIGDRSFTMRRCHLHDAENAGDFQQDIIFEDNYVPRLYSDPVDPHEDGIQLNPAASNILIRHNTIFCVNQSGGLGTSAIISPSVGAGGTTNVTIANNLVGGGAFAIYGTQGGAGTNMQIYGNRFTTRFAPDCGAFGPWTDCTDEAVVSDNRWYDGPNAGQLLT